MVAAFVVLLVVLLVEGCVSKHAQASRSALTAAAARPKAPSDEVIAAETQPVSTAPAKMAAPPCAPPAGLIQSASRQPASLYVVKHGDTLIRIARLHGTTVKALKAVNGLASDALAVGAELKLPPA